MPEDYFQSPQEPTVSLTACIRDVGLNLDQSMLRVAFVVENGRVIGSISDGDIRRALLAGSTLDSPILDVFNPNFAWVTTLSTPADVQRAFKVGVDVLPVLDNDGHLVSLIRRGATPSLIPIAEPEITTYETELVLEAVQSGWVSSVGRFVGEFEQEFAAFTGSESAVSVNNGTSALALAMWALGIGVGDEVLVPDLTFGATANAVVQVGGRPVLVDIDPESWSVTPDTLNQALTKRTKGILVVHLYGYPAPLDSIWEFASKNNLLVIEDCAEAVGTRYGDSHVGSRSDAGAFSFFGNKTITTGEGGMVTFRDLGVAANARQIRAHGMSNDRRYWHEAWGTNLRLTNIQAALGLAQLRRIDSILARKNALAQRYDNLLAPMKALGLQTPALPPTGQHSHWLYTVLLPDGVDPDLVCADMLRDGVETRRVFYPLHLQPAFEKYANDTSYPVSSAISDRGLSLPSSVTLSESQLEHVAGSLEKSLRALL